MIILSVMGSSFASMMFASLDPKTRERYSLEEVRVRPFGINHGDLEVNFRETPHPLLAMQVLHLCVSTEQGELPDEFFHNLPVGRRIQALFDLAALPWGSRLELGFICEEESCGERMELEITSEEIAELQDEASPLPHVEVHLSDKKIAIRRPTGADQLRWIRQERKHPVKMLCDLLANPEEEKFLQQEIEAAKSDPATSPEKGSLFQEIEELMEEADPLTHFQLTTSCPECGRENTWRVNLEEISLRLLYGAQQNFLQMIHSLARAYHWSEPEILALPEWRRRHYLHLLQREVDL